MNMGNSEENSVKSSRADHLLDKRRKLEKIIQKLKEDRSRVTKRLQEKKVEKERLVSVLRPWARGSCFLRLIELREREMEILRSSLIALGCSETSPITRLKTNVKYYWPVGDKVISDMKSAKTYDYWSFTRELRRWEMVIEAFSHCPNKLHYAEERYHRTRNHCSCAQPKEQKEFPLHIWQNKMQHGRKSLAEEKKILREMKQIEEAPTTEEKANDDEDTGLQAAIPDFLGSKQAIRRRIGLIQAELKGLHKEDDAFETKMRNAKRGVEASENAITCMENKLEALDQEEWKSIDRILQLLNQDY